MTALPAGRRWRSVILIYAAGVLVAFQIGKVPAALPAMRADLGLSLLAASWVLAVFNVLAAFSGALAGVAGDRLGYRRTILFGLALAGAASLAGAGAATPAWLLAARFVEGVGFILVVAAAPGYIVALTDTTEQRLALGLWATYMPAGTSLMLLLAPLLMAWQGWRGLWLVNAALVAAGFALIGLVAHRGRERPGRAHQPLAAVWRTVTAPGPLALALCFAAYTLQFFAVIGFLPLLLVEQQALAASHAAMLTALVVAANAIGNITGGWLLQRGLPRWQLIVGTSVVMAACVPGIYDPQAANATRYLLALGFSAVGGIIPAVCIAATPVHAPTPQLVGTTNGVVMQGSQVGQLAGPPCLALLVSQFGGWQVAPWLLVLAAAAASATALWIRRLEQARGS